MPWNSGATDPDRWSDPGTWCKTGSYRRRTAPGSAADRLVGDIELATLHLGGRRIQHDAVQSPVDDLQEGLLQVLVVVVGESF